MANAIDRQEEIQAGVMDYLGDVLAGLLTVTKAMSPEVYEEAITYCHGAVCGAALAYLYIINEEKEQHEKLDELSASIKAISSFFEDRGEK